ncbi:MAG: hypothetical protein V2J07_07230 [Anaerolineae bacterium]|jgi:hypothetical protein|nr:hypothetical protein [Anaerolineae bacterium]
MRQSLPFWVRSLIFITAVVLLFFSLQYLFEDPVSSPVRVVEAMIEAQDAVDIVIGGSSMAFYSLDPRLMDQLMEGTKTINISRPSFNAVHLSLLLQQLLASGNTPEIVVLDAYALTANMNEFRQNTFFNAYSHTWDTAYLSRILDYYPLESLPDLVFPFIHQHENWKNPDLLIQNVKNIAVRKAVLVAAQVEQDEAYQNGGFQPLSHVIFPQEYLSRQNSAKTLQPDATNLIALQNIVALSEQYDFQVIVLLTPFPQGYDASFKHIEEAMQQYGLAFYNLNQSHANQFTQLDFIDGTHTNAQGAVMTTAITAEIIAREVGRALNEDQLLQVHRLSIQDITTSTQEGLLTISIVPEDPTADWQVEWNIHTSTAPSLGQQAGNSLAFAFPENLLLVEGFLLDITIEQQGMAYPLRLQLQPENLQ